MYCYGNKVIPGSIYFMHYKVVGFQKYYHIIILMWLHTITYIVTPISGRADAADHEPS